MHRDLPKTAGLPRPTLKYRTTWLVYTTSPLYWRIINVPFLWSATNKTYIRPRCGLRYVATLIRQNVRFSKLPFFHSRSVLINRFTSVTSRSMRQKRSTKLFGLKSSCYLNSKLPWEVGNEWNWSIGDITTRRFSDRNLCWKYVFKTC